MNTSEAPPALQKRKKALAGGLALSVAATALLGGATALYTDSDSTEEQKLQAGTVIIEVNDDGAIRPFSEPIAPMAPGDRISRYVTLTNTGNLGVTNLSLAQSNDGGALITDEHGLLVEVETCDQPWVDGVCGGEHYHSLEQTSPNLWRELRHLGLPELAPGKSWYFKFINELPTAAENHLQAEGAEIQYTFNGVQPAGKEYSAGPRPVPPLEEWDEDDRVDASDLEITVEGPGRLRLDWKRVVGAVNYRVERTTNPALPATDLIVYGDRNQAHDSSVEANQLYYYRVVTVGESGQETEGTWTPVLAPLAADFKHELTAVKVEGATEVTWASLPEEVGYSLERYQGPAPAGGFGMSAAPKGEWVEVASGKGASSYRDEAVEVGGQYWYRLTVTGSYGEKLTSTPLQHQYNLTAPAVTMERPTLTRVELSWAPVEGAAQYRIRKIGPNGKVNSTTDVLTEETEWSEELAEGEAWTYLVLAESADRVLASSSALSASSDPRAPQVQSLTSTASSLTAAWAPVEAATSYLVEVSVDGTFTDAQELSQTVEGTSVTVGGLESHSEYFLRVTARGQDWSATSAPLTATTRLLAPVVTKVTPAAESAVVEWEGGSKGVTYMVYFDGRYLAVRSGTKATLTGLTANRSYSVRVEAVGPHSSLMGAPVEVKTLTHATPLSLRASAASVTASWKAVEGASYKLERSATAAMEDATVAYEGSGTSFTDSTVSPGQAYYYRLTTLVGGEAYEAEVKLATTPISTPTLSGAVAGDTLGLYWAPVAGAVRYEVQDPQRGKHVVTEPSYEYDLVEEKVERGTRETFTVTAIDRDGRRSEAATHSVALTLAQPELSVVSGPTEPATRLAWGETPYVKSYELWRASSVDGKWKKLADLPATSLSFTDEDAAPRASMSYRLVAVASAAAASATSENVTASHGTPPEGLEDLHSANFDEQAGVVELTAKGEAAVDLLLYADPNSAAFTVVDPTATEGATKTYSSFKPGKRYYAQVRVTEGERVYYGEFEEFSPELAAPKPTAMATINQLQVTWPAVAGAEGYLVSWRQPGGEWRAPAEVTGTGYVVHGLHSNTAYEVRVVAKGEDFPSEPGILETATAINGGQLRTTLSSEGRELSWDAVAGTQVTIERATKSDFSDAEVLVAPGTTSENKYTDGPREPGAKFYYRALYEGVRGQVRVVVAEVRDALATPVLGVQEAANVFNLTWGAVEGASTYKLYDGEALLYEGGATSFALTGSFATDYRFRLVAESEAGVTSSVTQSYSTSPEASALVVEEVSAFAVDLAWGLTDSASSYRLYRFPVEGAGGGTLLASGPTVTSHRDTTMAPSASYRYVLETVGKNGKVASVTQEVAVPEVAVAWASAEAQAEGNHLEWEALPASSSVVSYAVQRSLNGTTGWVEAARVDFSAAPTFVDSTVTPGQRYFYKVVALAEDGSTVAASPATDPLDTPLRTDVSGLLELQPYVNIHNSGYSVFRTKTFSSVADVKDYTWQWRRAGASTVTSSYTRTTPTAYSYPNLPGGLAYELRLKFTATKGGEYYSAWVQVPPTFNSTQVSLNTVYQKPITLTWNNLYPDPAVGAEAVVERSRSADFSDGGEVLAVVAAETGSRFVDATVEPGERYYYRVKYRKATEVEGEYVEGAYNTPVTAVAGASGTPVITSVVNASPTDQTVTWERLEGLQSLSVLVRSNTGANITYPLDVNSTSFTAPIAPSSTWTYQLQARSANGYNQNSPQVSLTSEWGAPRPRANGVTPTTFAMAWALVADSSYTVQVSTDPDFQEVTTVATLGANVTNYTYSNLEPGKKYYFRLQSRNTRTNQSSTSIVLSEVTPFAERPQVQALTATPTSTPTASLQVQHALTTNADSYTVEAHPVGSPEEVVTVESTASGVSGEATVEGLLVATAYRVRVVAKNSAGAELATEWTEATTRAPAPVLERGEGEATATLIPFKVTNTSNQTLSYIVSVYSNAGLTELAGRSTVELAPGTHEEEFKFLSPLSTGTYYLHIEVANSPSDASSALDYAVVSTVPVVTSITGSDEWLKAPVFTFTWDAVSNATAYEVEAIALGGATVYSETIAAAEGASQQTRQLPLKYGDAAIRLLKLRSVSSDGKKSDWAEVKLFTVSSLSSFGQVNVRNTTGLNGRIVSCRAEGEIDQYTVRVICDTSGLTDADWPKVRLGRVSKYNEFGMVELVTVMAESTWTGQVRKGGTAVVAIPKSAFTSGQYEYVLVAPQSSQSNNKALITTTFNYSK